MDNKNTKHNLALKEFLIYDQYLIDLLNQANSISDKIEENSFISNIKILYYQKYGDRCQICNFSFYENFKWQNIEVLYKHHLNLDVMMPEGYQNIEELMDDFYFLCPNCFANERKKIAAKVYYLNSLSEAKRSVEIKKYLNKMSKVKTVEYRELPLFKDFHNLGLYPTEDISKEEFIKELKNSGEEFKNLIIEDENFLKIEIINIIGIGPILQKYLNLKKIFTVKDLLLETKDGSLPDLIANLPGEKEETFQTKLNKFNFFILEIKKMSERYKK